MHSLQVCVEVSTDIIAMLTHDLGFVVEDDYSIVENLIKENIIDNEEGQFLRSYNGMRNAIVHRYNDLDINRIEEGLESV